MNFGTNSPPMTRGVHLPRHASLKKETRYTSDNMPYQVAKVYNGTGSALVANRPYLVTYAGSSVTVENPRVTALAAVAGPYQVVIAEEAIPNGEWGWVCFQGYHDCGVEGTTDVAAGDFLKVAAGTSTSGLVKDGTSRTVESVAIACAAQASNAVVDKRVFLLGDLANNGLAGAFSTASFSDDLTLADAADLVLGSTTGTKIGTATTQKLGFYNATPIVQPTGITQTFATADGTHAARTATAVTNAFGTANGTFEDTSGTSSAIANNFQECATTMNATIVDLADTAQLLNFVIDKLQALGLLA